MGSIKNILVTGNLGYIGPILVEELLKRSYQVTGLDSDLYQGCELVDMSFHPHRQIFRDVRDILPSDLEGIDAIIHLAGLSNDPLGEFNAALTEEINLQATIRLGQMARAAGIQRFVYASSQSMYGISKVDAELDEDNSEKVPQTAYARTKWEAELALKALGTSEFTVVCFRPSTVFGVSPRLRCDIVFNNLVACAYTTGTIEIKSDGTPWRPVVHVRDVSNAFISGIEAPLRLVQNESFNVGIENGNYSVKDLAEAAQRAVPGCTLNYTGEHGNDARTYRVAFNKILSQLKGYYKPEWNLERGGDELVTFFKKIEMTEDMFRGERCNRLQRLNARQKQGFVDSTFHVNSTQAIRSERQN